MPTGDDFEATVSAICAAHADREGPMLPILHDVQAEYGYIPQEAMPVIAKRMNVSRAEVHGVVSFYHDFRETPAGARVVKLCRAEACKSVGADALADDVRARLGVDWHGTKDGVTLEPVYCLGLCACGPSAMVDGRPIARADVDAVCGVAS